jgi:CRP-like cAMP-binding protein
MALVSGRPRVATVVAESDAEVLELPGDELVQLARAHPSVGRALSKFCSDRVLAMVLATSPVFRPVAREQRREILTRFSKRRVQKGERILEEGVPSPGLFVVLWGALEVSRGDAVVA